MLNPDGPDSPRHESQIFQLRPGHAYHIFHYLGFILRWFVWPRTYHEINGQNRGSLILHLTAHFFSPGCVLNFSERIKLPFWKQSPVYTTHAIPNGTTYDEQRGVSDRIKSAISDRTSGTTFRQINAPFARRENGIF